MKKILILMLLTFSVFANNWQNELDNWKTTRLESLKKPHGWLSLIGMEWFHNGSNTIGSAADNAIVLPHGPAYIGTFNVSKNIISFSVNKDVTIKANDKVIESTIPVKMDSSGEPTVFTIDTFQFYVIERGKPALRIKDSSAKTLSDFKGLDYFEATDKFRVNATFHAYDPVKEIEIINVLGLLSKDKSLGKLSFEIDEKQFNLDVLDAGDDYYIIFADKTSGRSTYGPGRFLYVAKPANEDQVVIDFNQAYNPPCAFTDYSTCPLPPPQNRLNVYINAGEKKHHR